MSEDHARTADSGMNPEDCADKVSEPAAKLARCYDRQVLAHPHLIMDLVWAWIETFKGTVLPTLQFRTHQNMSNDTICCWVPDWQIHLLSSTCTCLLCNFSPNCSVCVCIESQAHTTHYLLHTSAAENTLKNIFVNLQSRECNHYSQ